MEQSYLPEHNRRYQRTPASQEDFHRPKPGLRRLEEVFCLEQARILSQDWMVRYDNGLFQIQRHSRLHAPAEAKLTVQEWEDGRLEMRYRGQKIAWQEIAALPTRPEPPPQAVTAIYRPPATHPWRRDYREMLTRGTARNGETIWRRKAVEKTQSGKVKNRLCRFAWKSRKPRGIPTHYKRAPL